MSVLVLGGTKGIGRAAALRLARPGRLVAVNGHRDREAAESTADALRDAGAEPLVVMGDVSSEAGAKAVLAEVAARTRRLDALVHSVVRPTGGRLLELPAEEFDRCLRTSAFSLLHAVRAADPLLADGSAVVFISSVGAQRVVPSYGPIGVAKATAEALVRYLAVELAPRGARVNTVSSGPIGTDAYRSVFAEADERLASAAERSPAGRLQTVEEVAEVIHMLCEPGTALVQGQHVRVDGGMYL